MGVCTIVYAKRNNAKKRILKFYFITLAFHVCSYLCKYLNSYICPRIKAWSIYEHITNFTSKPFDCFRTQCPTVCATSLLVIWFITVCIIGQITVTGFAHTVGQCLQNKTMQNYTITELLTSNSLDLVCKKKPSVTFFFPFASECFSLL